MQQGEEGIGYIESLIAITIAGIACVALLSTAVMVMREAKNNEYRDAMDFYSLQGFERVRSISVSDYDQILDVCNDGHAQGWGKLTGGGDLAPISDIYEVPLGLCWWEDASGNEGGMGENGECEKLEMPGNPDAGDTFFRLVQVEDVGSSGCARARIKVHVGLFPDSGPDPDPVRNFDTDITLIGYVAE